MRGFQLFLVTLILVFGFLHLGFADDKDTGLQLHNEYRSLHSADSLSLSNDLSNRAEHCAEHYASIGTIDHSCEYAEGYGENLYWTSESSISGDDAARAAVEAWYSEASEYDYDLNQSQSGLGHFSQMVWRGSTELGVGVSSSSSGGTFVVCMYSPAGNVAGEYTDNVLRP